MTSWMQGERRLLAALVGIPLIAFREVAERVDRKRFGGAVKEYPSEFGCSDWKGNFDALSKTFPIASGVLLELRTLCLAGVDS
jgi:hypothetical protein